LLPPAVMGSAKVDMGCFCADCLCYSLKAIFVFPLRTDKLHSCTSVLLPRGSLMCSPTVSLCNSPVAANSWSCGEGANLPQWANLSPKTIVRLA